MPKKLGPFDFIASINEGSRGKNLFDDSSVEEKAYVAFIINRGFSYFSDSCLLANEMNRRPGIPPRAQYDFLRFSMRPRKRFSKWLKNETSDDLELVKRAYSCSAEKAREIASILTSEALQSLRRLLDPGGSSGRGK